MMRHIADEAEHIYLALGATDFRKQQNGLAALVSLNFKLDPYCGKSVFLFCNKKHSSLRALRWDGNGFILVTKFLSDEMKFQWPKTQGEVRDISKRQLEWLLEGLQIDQKKLIKRPLILKDLFFKVH
jgi:transposase